MHHPWPGSNTDADLVNKTQIIMHGNQGHTFISLHCYNMQLSFRMKTVALFLVMAASLHIRCCTVAAQQVPFTLVDSRATRSNIITLRCRNSNDIFDPHAMYYLNGTRLELFNGFVDTSQDPGTVVFQMKRTLEGEYFCGTEHQRSDVLSFVGKFSICCKDSLRIKGYSTLIRFFITISKYNQKIYLVSLVQTSS